MHCVVRVENRRGETIKGAVNIPPNFENGRQLVRLIETEEEIRLIAQEAMSFLNKCKESNNGRYCKVTIEVALDGDLLVPETTVKVPSIAERELGTVLRHIKDVCRAQLIDFLMEERKDTDMDMLSYALPAFFKGDIYSTLFR